MPVINTLIFDFARAVLDDSVDGIVAEQNATNAICDLFRSQQEEIDRLKKELAEANEKILMTEAQIDELIIGVAAKLHQKTFEAGKHDHPWCEEVEKQHRLFLRFIQFENKNSLYDEFSQNLKKLEEEEVQMEIERMEQKSKEFSEANLSVVKLRLEKKITEQEGKDMLKEKFPDMVSDDEDVDSRDAPNIYPYKKCSECGERSSCGQYKEDDWVCEGCGCDDEEYCDNCDTELTEDTHIFIFTKGEDEKIMCDTCGQELAEKMRKDGWIRDDDE